MSSSPSSSPPPADPATPASEEAVGILTVLTGARAGLSRPLRAAFATMGRHPTSDLQLDPDRDLEVSARHAAVFRQGGAFVVRDLGSTNGTWVNGVRILSDRALEPGDRIRLGPRGPEVAFALGPVCPVGVASSGDSYLPEEGPPDPTSERAPAAPATAAPASRRRGLWVVGSAVAGVLAIAALGLWAGWGRRDAEVSERERLLAQVDSLERVLAGTSEQASGLRQALDSARAEAAALRQQVTAAGTGDEGLAALEREVSGAVARHGSLLRAAGFDAARIAARGAGTVVMLFTEYPDGRVSTATGFLVRSRGDTGWVATARHAVLDARGNPPARLALAFAARGGVFPAEPAAADDSLDLALVRVVLTGGPGPAATLGAGTDARAGDPVAMVGFPLGLELPQDPDWRRTGLKPTTTVASVSRVLADRLQLDGYGAEGASGSPVFGVRGEVVGMLYGGQAGTGGRVVYAVDAAAIRALLDRR